METCKIPECTDVVKKLGMCNRHYMQVWTDRNKGVCTIEGCNNNVYVRKICLAHYTIWRKHRPDKPRCSVKECDKPTISKGMCSTHYKKSYRENSKCTVDDCENQVQGHGMCKRHLTAYKKSSEGKKEFLKSYKPIEPEILKELKILEEQVKAKVIICKENNCHRKVKTKEYCSYHYKRWLSLQDNKCKYYNCENNVVANNMCNKHYKKAIKIAIDKENKTIRCKINFCGLPAHLIELCHRHYDLQYSEKYAEVVEVEGKFILTCKIEGCSGQHRARGLCIKHYNKWHTENTDEKCSIEGCEKNTYAKRLCTKHYQFARVTKLKEEGKEVKKSTCAVQGCEKISYRRGYCYYHNRTLPGSKKCKLEGCNKVISCKGLCHQHYYKWKMEQNDKICRVEGCNSGVRSKDLCSRHYQRFLRNMPLEDVPKEKPEPKIKSIRRSNKNNRNNTVSIPQEIYIEGLKSSKSKPTPKKQKPKVIICNSQKCKNPAKTRGLCIKHYLQYKRNIAYAEKLEKEKLANMKQLEQEEIKKEEAVIAN